MLTLKNFGEHNEYVGLPEPLNEDIDVGRYEESEIRMKSPPVRIDFYRISYKKHYADNRAAVFFYSPKRPLEWDLVSQLEGYYLQLSQELINQHRFLFQNYMEYGEHEALHLTVEEEKEIEDIFNSLMRHYRKQPDNTSILVSYAHVLVNLVESYYQRQFSTDMEKYNRIVTEFQQLLHGYYSQKVDELPKVQYFADQLHLTPNYLGDIIKHHTNKTASEAIHDLIIREAKKLIMEERFNITQIAYELGFEYPNNFSKFFKNQTELTPSEFKKGSESSVHNA